MYIESGEVQSIITTGGDVYKLAVIVFLSAGIAAADEPKVLRNYMQPEVGYAYPAMPADTPLTRAEVIDWNRIFDLTKEQSSMILSMYESYVRDHRNPLFDRLMPHYLAKASEASKTLQASGVSSQEFNTVWQDTCRAANQLMIAALQDELQFIDSLVPVLTPAQVEQLEVLRGHAKRRKCHSVVTTDRWVNLELRDLWGNLPASQVTDENRAVIMAKLSEYERELTSLLEKWSASQLDAGRKTQDLLSGSARGAPDSEDNDPARIWARPAKVIKRIRDLHLRFNQDLLATLPGDVASEVQRVCQIRFFPEIYPDAAHANTVRLFSHVASDDAVTADVRSTVSGLREFYEQRYAELCKRLERACNQWDDDVASGVGEARPQNLVAAIQPDLFERRELSEDLLRRCEIVLGETPPLPPPGASRPEDAKK